MYMYMYMCMCMCNAVMCFSTLPYCGSECVYRVHEWIENHNSLGHKWPSDLDDKESHVRVHE